MKFRTECIPPQAREVINHDDTIVSLGSCFSQNIGDKLRDAKWRVAVNPMGIVYNPISLFKQIDWVDQGKTWHEGEWIRRDGLYHHFDLHGSFSDVEHSACLSRASEQLSSLTKAIKMADWLIITLGTSWVFQRHASAEIVANCHKFPSNEFDKILLDVHQVENAGREAINKLAEINPKLKLIFTVSPIRHLSNGLVDNNLSKATLLLAVDRWCRSYDHVSYFPAYELLIDDLRDYRYYDKDLAHPNELAVDYIWDKFMSANLSAAAIGQATQVLKLKTMLAHRPLNPKTSKFAEFWTSVYEQILKVESDLPHTDWTEEKTTWLRLKPTGLDE